MKNSFRYQEKDSIIHNLSPLVKLGWALALTVEAIIIDHPLFLLAMLLCALAVAAVGKVWREWAVLMRLALLLCLTITLINVLVSYHGSHVLWQADFRIPVIGVPSVTLESLVYGVGMSLRLLTIVAVFAVVTLTVHPDDMLKAMSALKLPSRSVLALSLAARFLPVLMADAERISLVQQSRGLQLDQGGPVRRIRNRAAVLIPLLSNSLDRTVQLAEAMESRAFGSGRRVFYKPLRLRSLDLLGLACLTGGVALAVITIWRGWISYRYFPTLESPYLNAAGWGLLYGILFLAASVIPVAWLIRRRQFD